MKTPLLFLLLFSSFHLVAQSKVEKLKADYLQVAFWNSANPLARLNKWENKDTITYAFADEITFFSEKNWLKFTTALGEITGKTILESDNKTADIHIYFRSLRDYAATTGHMIPSGAVDKFSNWNNRLTTDDGQLTKADFCVWPEKVANHNDGEYLLQKLFIKSFGVLGELEDEYSLFFKYYNTNNERPTRADKRLIKLHYMPEIKAGMTHKQVQQVVDTLDLTALASEKL